MIEHKHLIVRAEVLTPPGLGQVEWMRNWFRGFIEAIDMKILNGPHVSYLDVPGNRGFTGVCIIETSHIAMHVWDETDPALMQFDVYTCGALDIQKVFDKLQDFDPVSIEWKFLDREHGLNHISDGILDRSSLYLK